MYTANELTFFYATYLESIVDDLYLPYTIGFFENLGFSNIDFILDQRSFSNENIRFLAKSGYKFIIKLDNYHQKQKLPFNYFNQSLSNPKVRDYTSYSPLTFPKRDYGPMSTLRFYQEQSLADNQLATLERKLIATEFSFCQKNHLTKREVAIYGQAFSFKFATDGNFTFQRDLDKIQKLTSNFGFFCLLTNTNLDDAQTLEKYRYKYFLDHSFDELISYTSMKSLKHFNNIIFDSKIFFSFISLIIQSDLKNRLRKNKDLLPLNKAALIREMDKICVGLNNKDLRLLSPLTQTQLKIMKEFGLNATDLKAYLGGG
ncbi:MAG: hypothetical protein LBI10_01080 [Deltaproteobacteria bacterium]|nr:hypothetical protein [Deltaproteobacteria bacterium]